MIPCPTTSTIEITAGTGVDSSLLAGIYTISVEADILAHVASDAVYASEGARDAALPSPTSGQRAWITADDRLWIHDGTGWIVAFEPPQSYTPTLTNITQGNGTVTGWYQRSFGQCFFEAVFTFGSSGSAMGTGPALGLPKATIGIRRNALTCEVQDTGTNQFVGVNDLVAAAGTSVTIRYQSVTGALVNTTAITSTAPHTWANTDVLSMSGAFRMNTLYL